MTTRHLLETTFAIRQLGAVQGHCNSEANAAAAGLRARANHGFLCFSRVTFTEAGTCRISAGRLAATKSIGSRGDRAKLTWSLDGAAAIPGRSGLSRLILGSVAELVLPQSPVPGIDGQGSATAGLYGTDGCRDDGRRLGGDSELTDGYTVGAMNDAVVAADFAIDVIIRQRLWGPNAPAA
jgi:hypothetical protein